MTKRRETPPSPLSPAKRVIFTAVLVLIPVIALVGTELILRRIGYGGTLDLVVHATVAGREFKVLNRDVGRRYFAGSGGTVPEPSEDYFAVKKGRKTLRIFCLGESTMQGFPYEYHATPPAFLRDRLEAMLPGYTIEMINGGLSAVGSFVVQDFLRDVAEEEPDLVVLYLGHNEFYGVYGVGSAVSPGGSGWVTRLAVSLLRFRTYLLLRDLYLDLRGALSPSGGGKSGTLMAQMVGDRAIPYRSPLYENARAIYEHNLRAIIACARERGIPLLFSTLVSNLRDQQPFVSLFAAGEHPPDERSWRALMDSAAVRAAAGDVAGSLAACRAAVRLDTMYAGGFYTLGLAYERIGAADSARMAFERARDLDALRFRASGEFQQVLLEVCRDEGVPVARVDSSFAAASPNGIVGSSLILEHLHPNVDGYFLMAGTWAEAIREAGLLAPRNAWVAAPDDSLLMARSTVSAFDRLVGKIRIAHLIRRWPFTETEEPYRFVPADDVEGVVYRYVQGKSAWSEARYELADVYARAGRYDLARTEALAVAKVLFFSYQPLLRVADYYLAEGNLRGAQEVYRRCAEVEDNPFSRMKLALILLEQDDAAGAAAEAERALAFTGPRGLKPPAFASALFVLGGAYARLGRIEDAKDRLRRALAIDPRLDDARRLLGRLETRGHL